jgi:hypothetical protein
MVVVHLPLVYFRETCIWLISIESETPGNRRSTAARPPLDCLLRPAAPASFSDAGFRTKA